MNGPIKLLLINVNESDKWRGCELHLAIVNRLMKLGIAGASSYAGLAGYGHQRRLHHKGLFGIPDDRSVGIVAIDSEKKLRAVIPELKEMVKEGLIVLLDAELVLDAPG